MRTSTKSGLLLGTLLAAGSTVLSANDVRASSHREAPFITKNPKVDGTDFYMFRSFEAGRAAFVTVVANYLPLQNQYGGPNFFSLDPEALYEIHLDNTGDAQEDITFQFRFSNDLANAGAGTKIPVGGEMVAIPLAHREIRLNRATSLTVRHIDKTPASDALAQRLFETFAKL